MKTGEYEAPHPYYYTKPSTHEPPLYSVLLYFMNFIARSDILIHFIHIVLLFISAILLFKILKQFLNKEIAKIISIFYLFIPSHFTYISALMTEIFSIFTVSLYLFIAYLVIKGQKKFLLKYLVIISAVMVLLKYGFIIFFFAALLLFIISKKKNITDFVAVGIGVAIICLWILVNHAINGSWGLSSSTGKHIYNRVVDFDHLLPEEKNESLKKLRIYTEGKDIFQPWWILEHRILTNMKGDEVDVSKLLGEVAIAAIKKNPLFYIFNTPKWFIVLHSADPTHSFYIKNIDLTCRSLGTIHFCKPIISSEASLYLWDKMVSITDKYSRYVVKYFHFLLLFPAIIFAFITKDSFMRFSGTVYFLSTLTAVMTELPAARYLYSYIPIMLILVSFMLKNIVDLVVLSKKKGSKPEI